MLSPEVLTALSTTATTNVRDILTHAIEHNSPHRALVVYDTDFGLTQILTDAYRTALPYADFVDFAQETKEAIIARFDALAPRDLVVLIQSMDFRLNDFRIRIQLFQRKLKVIDHLHLSRNPEETWETYVNALAYDPAWYRTTGHALKRALMETDTLTLRQGDHALVVTGGVEIPKLNIGDYTGMENIGGTFPIGEVFTEAKDLLRVSGSLMIYAFADTSFNIAFHEPFRVDITDGLVSGWGTNAPEGFREVIEAICTHERPLMREIGFGLNRAITLEHYLPDITAFERIHGLHISLGEKHTVYKKQGITPDKTRFHVDIFPVVDEVRTDTAVLYSDGTYRV